MRSVVLSGPNNDVKLIFPRNHDMYLINRQCTASIPDICSLNAVADRAGPQVTRRPQRRVDRLPRRRTGLRPALLRSRYRSPFPFQLLFRPSFVLWCLAAPVQASSTAMSTATDPATDTVAVRDTATVGVMCHPVWLYAIVVVLDAPHVGSVLPPRRPLPRTPTQGTSAPTWPSPRPNWV